MEKFIKHTGTAVPLRRSNVDTDQIIPAVYLKRVTRSGFEDGLFSAWRSDPDFVLNKPEFAQGTILVAGVDFGTGSSREHAAMEPRHLGVRAVLVKSFARIHETNLKKQGMLALTFDDKADYEKFREDDNIDINGLIEFAPNKKLTLALHHSDGTTDTIQVNHSYNEQQIEWFKEGAALNIIRRDFAKK